MNMKKVLALTLSVTMALSVTGCTSAENSSSTESKTEQSESTGLSLSGKTFHVGGQLRQTPLKGRPSSVWAETHRSIMRLVMRKRLG